MFYQGNYFREAFIDMTAALVEWVDRVCYG